MNSTSFSPDQQRAFDAAQKGEHCLITGPGGTGKSYLIEKLKQSLPRCAVVATTGIAAVNVGGLTIHSWSGMGMAKQTAEELMQLIMYKDYKESARDNIRGCDTLIIDEISMLGAGFWQKLDQVLRAVRRDERPFGGIQLLMFGDFLQLPPVKDDFIFTTNIWEIINPVVVELTTIHRTKDKEFAELLTRIRKGEHTRADCNTLVALGGKPIKGQPLILHTHNANVDTYNNQELAKLSAPLCTYHATDNGSVKDALYTLQKECRSPAELKLKVGARVMGTKNTDTFANGDCGTVTDLVQGGSFEDPRISVQWDNGYHQHEIKKAEWVIEDHSTREVIASRKQFPLRLAWAVTVHKSQGMTLSSAVAYLDKCFAPGQIYVALSRLSNSENLWLPNFNPNLIRVNRDALRFYNNAKTKV